MTAKIKGTQTQEVEIAIDVFDIPRILLNAFGWNCGHDDIIRIENDELRLYRDESYHGSPDYRFVRCLTNNPDKISLYRQIIAMQKTMDNIHQSI